MDVVRTEAEKIQMARRYLEKRGYKVMPPAAGKFLRIDEVVACVPFSAATVWRKCAAGTFPAPIKASANTTVWRADDVERWIEKMGKTNVDSAAGTATRGD